MEASARTTPQRVDWLQERLAHHLYVCRHGAHHAQWFACKARRWTARELTEARGVLYHHLSTRDWTVATMLADRVYPGTRAWLLSCSSGEGGHGGFVWNHQGSGSGGWMQFLRSTYSAHVSAARVETARRGFSVQASSWSYFHPLGQALTAAYMRSHGMSSHWDPSIDHACR